MCRPTHSLSCAWFALMLRRPTSVACGMFVPRRAPCESMTASFHSVLLPFLRCRAPRTLRASGDHELQGLRAATGADVAEQGQEPFDSRYPLMSFSCDDKLCRQCSRLLQRTCRYRVERQPFSKRRPWKHHQWDDLCRHPCAHDWSPPAALVRAFWRSSRWWDPHSRGNQALLELAQGSDLRLWARASNLVRPNVVICLCFLSRRFACS